MDIFARRLKPKRRVVLRYLVALTCAVVQVSGETIPLARAGTATLAQDAPKIPADQLDSLVAPIALYPDSLLSQTLVASTYPLEILQLQQWLDRNQDLARNQKKLTEAVSKQPWDPSIQAMTVLPDVVKRLADDIQWTTDLGNAFLAQQSDVMDAIQRMRRKAQEKGSLQSNEQQKVVTQTVESKQVIVIEQANPEVVYVPSYDPLYVWGSPVWPYPRIYYPPYYGSYYAAAAISFGLGIAIGAAWGGGWGWGCGWGHGDIDINRNNNFNRNTNIAGGNRVNPLGGRNTWQHNPSHRGGAPYSDRNTANRFGGTTRGDSLANRQSSARGQVLRHAGVGDRGGGGRSAGGRTAGDRASGGRDPQGSGSGKRNFDPGGAGGTGGPPGNRGVGGDRIGNRALGSSSSRRGAFGGFNRSDSRSSSGRGSSSMSRAAFSGESHVEVVVGDSNSRKGLRQSTNAQTGKGAGFATAQKAVDALVAAAEKYDEKRLLEILGPHSDDIVHTGEPVGDREMAMQFGTQARIKQSLAKGPRHPNRMVLNVGSDDWPFPIPLVKLAGKWYFDMKEGRREILVRRIGRNELDAIEICHGYVEAQHEYAMLKRGQGAVNQFAQRIIATPGSQDGLAWQKPDGTWDGSIGENIAKAIARGFTSRNEPYRGYFFQVLKGQGPAAPLEQLDYVVKGVMIGGFALLAAPAQYRVTGVKTFMVSQDGVVYEKDLGPNTLEIARGIDRFNPDLSWSPVLEPQNRWQGIERPGSRSLSWEVLYARLFSQTRR